MAVTTSIIAKRHNAVTFKVVATADADTTTIDIGGANLLSVGQTADGATKLVNLARVHYSVSGTGKVTITRNSVPIAVLFGQGDIAIPSSEENSSNITLTFSGSAGGTVILELAKVQGFGAINPAGSI